ncbi:MAG: inositol monophosphatase family protein [Nitrospinales bacterium]
MDLIFAKDSALSYLKPVSKEILNLFRSDLYVELKVDRSPVTIADKKAEEYLRKKISRDFPDHGIIGEEFGEENSSREWVWTIDPIDGTRSFIHGIPLFSTLLSLLHNGEPVMGIICLPALKETAWAIKGKGSFIDDHPIKVSDQNDLSGATVATADRYCFKEKKYLKLWQNIYSNADIARTYPDAFGHLLAARGSVDVMIDPWAYIWDFAPCKIIIEEAGGLFSNFTGNKGRINEGTAISGNPQMVKKVKKLLQTRKIG